MVYVVFELVQCGVIVIGIDGGIICIGKCVVGQGVVCIGMMEGVLGSGGIFCLGCQVGQLQIIQFIQCVVIVCGEEVFMCFVWMIGVGQQCDFGFDW